MEEICSSLQYGVSRLNPPRDDGSAKPAQPNKQYGVAMQMKLLMDAPELVWSALEQREYCSAAYLYLLAKSTYFQLTTEPNKEIQKLLKNFPIISRQWTSISPFKENILAGIRATLMNMADDTTTIRALSAMVVLNNVSCEEACDFFLQSRHEALQAILEQDLTTTPVKDQVCAAVSLVVATLRQLYTLFLPGGPQQDVGEQDPADTTGQFYPFLSTFTTAGSECAVTPRLEDIFGNNHVLRATLPESITSFVPEMRSAATPVAPALVTAKCAKWLEAVTDVVRAGCGKILRHVPNVAGLADIRDKVWDVLKAEYALISKVIPQRSILMDVGDEIAETPLKQLCSIIGDPVSRFEPWSRMLQPVLAERAQAVLSGMFRVTIEDAQSTLRLVPAEAGANETEAGNTDNLAAALWSGANPLPADLTRHRDTQGWDTLPFVKLLSQYTGGYTPEVTRVVQRLSDQLDKILQDAQCLLGGDADGKVGRGRGNASTSMLAAANMSFMLDQADEGEPPFDKDGDSSETRRFLQAACEKFVRDLVSWVVEQKGGADSAVAHVLFLGRVCRALADGCAPISKLMLLPVDAAAERSKRNRFIKSTRRVGARSRQQMSEHERRLSDTRASFTSACSACFEVWVSDTVSNYVPKFQARLSAEDWQCMYAQKRVWQQHKVKEESETGNQVETAVVLPTQPSGFVSNFLCRVSSEINTVGGHTVDRVVMLKLAQELMAGVVGAYNQVLAEQRDADMDKRRISQDGLVQILFDVGVLSDVLLGDGVAFRPGTKGASGESTVVADADALQARIRGEIDPFDLDVFSPFIKASLIKSYHRTSVLYGFFTQLNPTHAGQRPVISSTESHNMVGVADVAPRFPMLPLGTQTRHARSTAGRSKRAPSNPYQAFAF